VSISSGLTANNKVYDRTTTATLSSNTVVLTGVITGDTATLNTNSYTANFASAGVGNNIAVTASGLTLTGAAAGNYTLTQPASLAANITPAAVTITSGIAANNKIFDTTTAASLSSNNVVLAGVINGDTVSLNTNGYTATFASAGLGNNIAVTVTGLKLSGISAANYALTQPAGLFAGILAPSLQIAANLPNVVLSWTTNASAFVLNRTTNLSLAWTPVTNNLTVIGTNNAVTLNASSGNQFFKLIAP
jgi:endonuclease YncB( thermonuclease family)